jgi:hypothetical protein
MPKQFLNGSKIRSALQKVNGVRVPQHVRGGMLNPNLVGVAVHALKRSATVQGGTTIGKNQFSARFLSHQLGPCLPQVAFNPLDGAAGQR